MQKKIAIVIGHNNEARGARLVAALGVYPAGVPEYDFNADVARECARIARREGVELRIFRRRARGNLEIELEEVYRAADDWGADVALELHFNAFEDARARGAETLSSGSPRSLRLAGSVQRALVEVLGVPDRGVKTRAPGARGGRALISGRAPAVLVEPFFGSNEADILAVEHAGGPQAIALAIMAGAISALGSFPRADLGGSRTMKAARRVKELSAAGVGTGAAGALVTGGEDAAPVPAGEDAPGPGAVDLPAWLEALGAYWFEIFAAIMLAVILWQVIKMERARIDDHARGRR